MSDDGFRVVLDRVDFGAPRAVAAFLLELHRGWRLPDVRQPRGANKSPRIAKLRRPGLGRWGI
jgi:hypothetical protein